MKKIAKSKIFLTTMVAFVMGVFFGDLFSLSLGKIPLAVILLVCYFLILSLFRIPKIARILVILIISFCLGSIRLNSYLPEINQNHIAYYNNKGEYQIEGIVSSEPDVREKVVKLQISNIKLQTNNKHPISNINGKILLDLPKYSNIQYGDLIKFSATLTEPKEYESFSYKNYLARFGVYSLAKNVDDLELIEKNKRSLLFSILYKIKGIFSKSIESIFPEPHSSFMLGLLIGAKKSLPEWLLEIFRITGITHIIAISGYNIAILARITEKTIGRIGRRYIFWGVLSLVVAFVILTGAQASIVRAGIMGSLLAFSGLIGRKSDALNVLIFAGAVMIYLNPLILKYDIGFQLSFLATLGLIYMSPILEKKFYYLPNILRESLVATLSAQVFVLPIILSNFGLLSIISPLANILVLPFIPIAMFLGFVSGSFGLISSFLGKVVGFFGFIILEIIIWISESLSQVPYASVEFKANNWLIWGLYYLLLTFLIWKWNNNVIKNRKK